MPWFLILRFTYLSSDRAIDITVEVNSYCGEKKQPIRHSVTVFVLIRCVYHLNFLPHIPLDNTGCQSL